MANFLDMSILNEATVKAPTLDNITVSDTILEDVSYFNQTVNFLIEYNHEFTEATKILYTGLLESDGETELITESFETFSNTVKKIIDKFLAFLKSIFQRFITNMNSMLKSEKYLKKHESEFGKFKDDLHKFDFEGYEFTLSENIPNAKPESEWIDDIDIDFADIAKTMEGKSGDELKKAISDAEKTISDKYDNLIDKLNNSYYDELRARVIGSNDDINESDFDKALFAVYRNGESDKKNIDITSGYINNCLNRFKRYESLKSSIEKNKRDIDDSYNTMKKELDTMVKSEGKNDTLSLTLGLGAHTKASDNYSSNIVLGIGMNSPTLLKQIELYKKAKINQVQQMSNIHALAFGAKLDAAKAMFVQDKTVLYKALYKIQGVREEAFITESHDAYKAQHEILNSEDMKIAKATYTKGLRESDKKQAIKLFKDAKAMFINLRRAAFKIPDSEFGDRLLDNLKRTNTGYGMQIGLDGKVNSGYNVSLNSRQTLDSADYNAMRGLRFGERINYVKEKQRGALREDTINEISTWITKCEVEIERRR